MPGGHEGKAQRGAEAGQAGAARRQRRTGAGLPCTRTRLCGCLATGAFHVPRLCGFLGPALLLLLPGKAHRRVPLGPAAARGLPACGWPAPLLPGPLAAGARSRRPRAAPPSGAPRPQLWCTGGRRCLAAAAARRRTAPGGRDRAGACGLAHPAAPYKPGGRVRAWGEACVRARVGITYVGCVVGRGLCTWGMSECRRSVVCAGVGTFGQSCLSRALLGQARQQSGVVGRETSQAARQ